MKLLIALAMVLLFPFAFVLYVLFGPEPDYGDSPITGTIFSNNHTPNELKQYYLTVDRQAQNIQQSGVNDRQIPLETRQDWAAKHGIAQPNE